MKSIQLFSFKLFLFLFVVIYSFNLKSNANELKWFSPTYKGLMKIDLKTGQVFKENIVSKKLELFGITKDKCPEIGPIYSSATEVFEARVKNKILLSLKGTSLVYQLIDQNRSFQLKRLDRSVFKGYNFYAYQFVRKDTLFSVGGYGFWSFSKVISYFDDINGSWEEVHQLNEGPNVISYDICGYDQQNDGIWTANMLNNFDLDNGRNSLSFYFFSLKNRKWTLKGTFNQSIFEQYNISYLKAFWVNQQFLFFGSKSCLLADPQKNKVRYFTYGETPQIANAKNVFETSDSIYFYRVIDTAPLNIFLFSSVGRNQFDSFFHDIHEPIYKTEIPFAILIWLLIGVAFLVIAYLIYKSFIKAKNESEFLNDQEIELLKLLFASPEGISTDTFNDFLNISKKNIDIQKNQRNVFIKNLNAKFLIKLDIENVIIRKSSENDKRFVFYCLNDEHLPSIKNKIQL